MTRFAKHRPRHVHFEQALHQDLLSRFCSMLCSCGLPRVDAHRLSYWKLSQYCFQQFNLPCHISQRARIAAAQFASFFGVFGLVKYLSKHGDSTMKRRRSDTATGSQGTVENESNDVT